MCGSVVEFGLILILSSFTSLSLLLYYKTADASATKTITTVTTIDATTRTADVNTTGAGDSTIVLPQLHEQIMLLLLQKLLIVLIQKGHLIQLRKLLLL